MVLEMVLQVTFFPSVSIQDLHQPVAMCCGCIALSLYHLTRSYYNCSIGFIESPLGSHHLSICCHTSIIVKKPIYWYIHYQYYCTQWGCEYQEVLALQPLHSETLILSQIRNTEDRVRLDIVASDFGYMGSLRGLTPKLGCLTTCCFQSSSPVYYWHELLKHNA